MQQFPDACKCSHYPGIWQHRAVAARWAHYPEVGGSNPPAAISHSAASDTNKRGKRKLSEKIYIHAAFPVPKPGLRTSSSIGESGVRTENNNESRGVGSNPTWSIKSWKGG